MYHVHILAFQLNTLVTVGVSEASDCYDQRRRRVGEEGEETGGYPTVTLQLLITLSQVLTVFSCRNVLFKHLLLLNFLQSSA